MSNKIFGAAWCGNCVTTKNKLDLMGIEYQYVDIDEEHDLAVANNIRSLPTLVTEAGDRAVGQLKIVEFFKSNEHLSSN